MRRFVSKLRFVPVLAVLVFLMAMTFTHADEVPYSRNMPFLDMVTRKTDCLMTTEVNDNNCVQMTRQIKALMAAMAAAICTIATVTTTYRLLTSIYAALAGFTALKAVFHQFMYITNGDLTIPALLVSASLVTIGGLAAGALLDWRENDDAGD